MRVVILTASTMKKTIDGKEFSGKCVTGYDLENNKIVRFVGNSYGAPMGNPFCDWFHPFDIVEVPIIKECPLSPQTENVLGDYAKSKWFGKYEESIEDLYQKIQRIPRDDPSFMRNRSYKVDDAALFSHSLELIKVQDLKRIEGQPKKCEFLYNGKPCRFFSVTDPEYTEMDSEIGHAYITVSIPSDSFEDKGYFKFVASIFPYEPSMALPEVQVDKTPLSVHDQLKFLSEGINPITGEIFDFDELSQDEAACHYCSVLIDKIGIGKTKNPAINSRQKSSDPIFKRLKEWRLKEAQSQGVPAFCVFSDRDLVEIASGNVSCKEDLLTIRGFGPKRYDLYGDAVFDILKEFI